MSHKFLDSLDTINHQLYNHLSKLTFLRSLAFISAVVVLLFAMLGVLASVYAIKHPPDCVVIPWLP
jgi:hypothetical protein